MNLDKIFQYNFIEYASYVIRDRAIPDVDDGFKPVQRRILHSLSRMDDGKYHKVANIVGHTMQFHPHGDASIYSALVNLANKEYFIERQGNFGNILTGDSAAAARYIEARLTPLARELLFNEKTTTFIDSYDGRNREPVSFPAKIPVLLLLGVEGIAVGMATKVLPHNLGELLEAQIKILAGESVVVVPDFIQGGLIDDSDYLSGNGKLLVRARIEVASPKSLLIRELPYGVTTASMISSIEDANKKGKIKVSSIEDYTAEKVEIEVIPSRGISTEELLPALYAFTDCQVSISANTTVIMDNKPCTMTTSEILVHNTTKLQADLERELRLELSETKDKLHEMTLERIFIENRIYKDIEEQETYELVIAAVTAGVGRYHDQLKRDVTADDVERLLSIRIKRISRFDLDQHHKKIKVLESLVREITSKLKDMTATTVAFLRAVHTKYAHLWPRRSEITSFKQVDVKKVALANIKVRYDQEKGYLGSDVKAGRVLSLTEYDKILVIKPQGAYQVRHIPAKSYVGEELLYVEKHDKDTIFNLVYQVKTSKKSYCKRFSVLKYIQDKEYDLLPEGAKIQAFSVGSEFYVKLHYKRRPRIKVLSENIDLGEQLVKGIASRGNQLGAGKEITWVKVLKSRPTATAPVVLAAVVPETSPEDVAVDPEAQLFLFDEDE